ncbi:DUF5710 domain-containing protein [Escherichia coli]|uniref:DUF5710 domain-containing protein n=1 Tax=Escherichia coli TaxID=562 RepID=UPI001C9A5098|nr:DUF5710 domain-containing protein [Escherichia coli]MBY7227777.1 DUF5710 domain-containing protein [Escherichia coli]MBY7258903.1 DUF5710 domain-containing protein [Escherichia coli]MBY7624706.1 DUF5710 domain-containing protein [Escherichia coli]
MTPSRTYLAIPHDQHQDVKKLAGKLEDGRQAVLFDREKKCWYARAGADLEKLKPWLPDKHHSGVSSAEAKTQFEDFLRANGAILDRRDPVMDGKKHRIRLQGDRGGKKSGSYVGHLNGHPNGWFNDFRDGGSEINATWSYSGEKPDPVAALHINAVNAQEAWDRAEQTRLLHDQKARTSAQRYKRTAQAGHDHPYLQKKGVQAARGVHIDNRQGLVIPLYNTDGQIRSIQTIDPEGNKRLAKDAEKAGNFFVVGGSLKDNHPIVLAEGYATAASCAMALRHPVVMTVDSGNLVKVAENLHARYPDSPMLFLGDDDLPKPRRPGNPGKEAAEKAARLTKGTAFVPQFTREEREQGLTDFNDLHQARGLAALTEQLTPVWQQVLARCPAKENIVKETPDNQATPVATNAADMPEMKVADNTAAGPAPAAETTTTDVTDTPPPAGEPETNAADNTAAEPAPAAETVTTDVADTPAPAGTPETNAADNAAAEPAPAAETVTTDVADTPAPAGAPETNAADNTTAEPAPAAETVATDVADTPAPDGAPEMNAADNTAAEPAPAAETATTDVADSPAPDGAPEMNVADNAAAESTPAAETTTTDVADNPAPDGAPEMNVADNTAAEPAPAAETVTTDVADSPAPDCAPEMNAAKAPADTDDINARLAAAMEYEDDEAYGYYDIPSSPAPRTSEAETQPPVQEDAPLPFQPPQKKQASPDTTEPDGIRIEKPPVENAIPSPLHDLNAIMKGLSHPYKGMDPKDIKYPLEMFLDGKHVFTDFVTHLTMASQEASRDDRAVLAALLTAQSHCQLKGEIELTGSDEFKQRAITLIATYDLKLKLKNPEQVEMLNQARARLQSEPVPGAEAEPLSPDANHILWQERSANVASAPQQSALPLDILPIRMETALPRNASHKEASSGITGQLLAFGPAHYNFDKQKDRSYYAHLRTRHGERLVWGIGLQEAIRNSGLKTGDMATLTMLGKKPVTVQVKKLGDDGKPLQNEHGGWIYEEKEVTRNQWEARPAVDPYVVARHTGQLAQPGELRPYHLGDYRALQAAVDDMARKAGTTPPTLPALPEVLWVQHNGQGVTTPRQTPASPELPSPHPEAGKLLMQLQDEATQQLKLLLVKARGDFVQGLVLHEGRHKPVLGRFVGQNGERHLILNEVTPQGLRPIGKGNAINNETGNYNSFVFTLKGERERILTQVSAPEKRPAALQQELGFSRPPVPPEQVTEMRNKPQNAPRRNHNAPRPGV